MTQESRWLDELPLESVERELLVAGKAARPSRDNVNANWRAFSIALSGTTSAAASAGAGHAISAKTASGIVATKAAAAGFLSAATMKSFAIGVALGVGVSAAGAVVERVRPREARPASAPGQSLAPRALSSARVPTPSPLAREASGPVVAPTAAEPGATAEFSVRAVPHTPTAVAPIPTLTSAPMLTAPALAPSGPSLSAQAHELARVKRLLDADATAEALRQLTANLSAGEPSALSEERDALYVQALTRAGRGDEARARAREFLRRYPRSPYVESIRRVAAE